MIEDLFEKTNDMYEFDMLNDEEEVKDLYDDNEDEDDSKYTF